MSPEQLLDEVERWAREVQRCDTGNSTAARRARGKLQFAREQVLDFLHQRDQEVQALREELKKP